MRLWTFRLIWANAVVFLLMQAIPGFAYPLVLVPAALPVRPWTLVTYMFLHGGLGHIFFNMLALFFFGPRLEARLGGRRFLGLYFVSGIFGALLSLVLAPTAAVIGASAATFGVLFGFARYWPRDQIFIWGVLPVEARVLVVVLAAAAMFFGFGGRGDGIAHFAHLGGFLGGWLYLAVLDRRTGARRFRAAASPSPSTGILEERRALERWSRIRPDELHEVNRAELERLRHKIETGGVRSLSAGDREFLDRFSAR